MHFFRTRQGSFVESSSFSILSSLLATSLAFSAGCSDEPSEGQPSGGGASASSGGANNGSASGSGGGQNGSGGVMRPVGTPGEFTIQADISTAIETVGIIEWSMPGQTVESAEIVFGPTADNLFMSAPVDLNEPGYRTLLLGMKPNSTYSFQILATAGGTLYESEVTPIETGFLDNGLPPIDITDFDASAQWGGFTIFCTGVGQGIPGQTASGGYALIFDRDGEYVWAYNLAGTAVGECSRARLSVDAKHLWIGNFSNVSPDGALMRVSMDGLVEDPPISLPGRHHDFALLPNGNPVFNEQENGGGYGPDGMGMPSIGMPNGDEPHGEGPDIIFEYDLATGQKTELYHQDTDFEAQIDESGAHTNHIEYVPHLDAISFSMRHSSQVAMITYQSGQPSTLLAAFSGPSDQFGMSWEYQHGHEVLPNNRLIVFNNADGNASPMLEFEFDLGAKTSTELPSYQGTMGGDPGAPPLGTVSFGDVQRLPNGNTFITYSNAGVIHEIDQNHQLLREISTDSFAYPQHVTTLYGPPPPFDQ